ncbi:MAG: hypothetical protein ACRCX2_09930, partial [Paraclostridium sp.]
MKYSGSLEKTINTLRGDYLLKRNMEKELVAKKALLESQIENLNLDNLNKALLLLQKLSQKQRQSARLRLEELGTKALQYSLGEQYSMSIKIKDTGKRPQAYL